MAKKSVLAIKKTKVSVTNYAKFLTSLKSKIRSAQIKGAIAVNKELIKLYWDVGKDIVEKQDKEGWGGNVLDKVVKDLQNEFPGIEGFSKRNIFIMRAFYKAYAKVQQAVAQLDDLPIFSIPWGHNALILEKIKDTTERLWYASKVIEHGWSRSMLTVWIENDLYKREGKAITNFKTALTSPQSDLAQQTLKDPYMFDFLTLHKEHLEKDLEEGLVKHIQKFLIELGQGFAFVGRQYHIKAGEQDMYIDLLFYHLKLCCYFIVELKGGKFDSKDAGQMSAYLSAVDDQLRNENDKPSIGIILCKTKDNIFAEYVLRNFNRPIGVAEFEVKLVEKLPKDLKANLPTIEEIEAELSAIPKEKKKKPKKNLEKKV
ncbi:MAG: PDDEXK nuclease domain-containing protein [Candidatus Rhabdochlamydia sp.]